jgi:hypothetical protein
MITARQTPVGARPNKRRETARLDQDVVGRLLDRMSDHSAREMTIRMGNHPTEPGLQIALPMHSISGDPFDHRRFLRLTQSGLTS